MRAKTKLKERHLGAGVTGRPPRGPGTFRRGLSSSCVFSNRSWLTGAGMTTTIKRRRVIDGRGKLDVGDRGRARCAALRRARRGGGGGRGGRRRGGRARQGRRGGAGGGARPRAGRRGAT